MSLQLLAICISFIGMYFLGILFIRIKQTTKDWKEEEYGPIIEKWYRIRKYWFFTLITVMGIATVISLQNLPFHKHEETANTKYKIVEVEAIQFGWNFSNEEFVVGQPYQFNITSKDVNHGFGIYDENMQLLAQVQAMPGYTNPVYFTFDKPGTYQILCLEYCSVGHHLMKKEITVKPNDGGHNHESK